MRGFIVWFVLKTIVAIIYDENGQFGTKKAKPEDLAQKTNQPVSSGTVALAKEDYVPSGAKAG